MTRGGDAYERVFGVYFKLVLVDDLMRQLEPAGLKRLGETKYSYGRAWRYQVKGAMGVYELVEWDVQRSLLRTDLPNLPVLEFSGPVFLVKYYPHPDEEVFEEFSAREQVLRLSPYFDYGESPYPTLNSVEGELDPTLFNVGVMHILADDALGIIRLSAHSQDRFISVAEEGVRVSNVLLVPPGGRDRNVPGWELTWKLLERIALVYRKVVGELYAAVGGIGEGRMWSCTQNSCTEQETSEAKLKLLELIFLSGSETKELARNVLEKIFEENIKVTQVAELRLALLWVGGELRRDEGMFPEVRNFLGVDLDMSI
uniref:Uncharacterized protein n=1 Tax=Thermofilum pendens TaxID=2269 RepID=A0A7C4BA50_THEPE